MIKDLSKSTEAEKSYQCTLADVESQTLPVEGVPDGSSCFIVDSFGVLIFHDGHWYDGKSVVQ